MPNGKHKHMQCERCSTIPRTKPLPAPHPQNWSRTDTQVFRHCGVHILQCVYPDLATHPYSDGEYTSLDSTLGTPSPSRIASCSSRSPRGDSRDSERKRPLGRVGRDIPLPPSSSAWKWVISANSPTFSCSSSTSARSFCCSSTADKEQMSTRRGPGVPRRASGGAGQRGRT